MNKIVIAVLVTCALLVGCQSRTSYGKCVGVGDKQDPKLEYKISARNVILGVIFVELIAPPVFVIVDETYCPVDAVK